MASPLIVARAFADVRPEAPALALFLLGALLIASASRRVALGALGVGLVAFAFLINPKWPLSSLALGLVFVAGAAPARRLAFAAAAVACALLLLAVSIDPRTYFDYVFLFNRQIFRWTQLHGTILAARLSTALPCRGSRCHVTSCRHQDSAHACLFAVL